MDHVSIFIVVLALLLQVGTACWAVRAVRGAKNAAAKPGSMIEADLRKERDQLRDVLEISERDRRLVAYDIHDGFVQSAAAALMHLQAGMAAYAGDPQKAQQDIERGLQLLQESLAQVRMLIRGLRPAMLEESGLAAAVEELVRDTESRAKVRIDWRHSEYARLPPPLEISIFRIIQESLANAVRHSKTDRIEIELTQADGAIRVRIQDWGCGFDAGAPASDRFGLEGIRERARVFAGVARIESAPAAGTCITVDFPLIGQAPAAPRLLP